MLTFSRFPAPIYLSLPFLLALKGKQVQIVN